MRNLIYLNDKLVVIQPKSQHKILYNSILYITTGDGLLRIHTLNHRKYVVAGSFREAIKQLQAHDFALCHRCHLVNLHHVQNIDLEGGRISLGNQQFLPLARRRIERFSQEWYQL